MLRHSQLLFMVGLTPTASWFNINIKSDLKHETWRVVYPHVTASQSFPNLSAFVALHFGTAVLAHRDGLHVCYEPYGVLCSEYQPSTPNALRMTCA